MKGLFPALTLSHNFCLLPYADLKLESIMYYQAKKLSRCVIDILAIIFFVAIFCITNYYFVPYKQQYNNIF
ncbi:hypothetical protein KsCSTR_38770 [Candidatus Kuenenia stuttgartiensis]|uniref:Uncharacterized protein n=1 Tax=Kuenenia stuttgartiensis TaxID=174633 RepID=A0A6G7GUK5_KUEST|nr:hypothetical protein KsCSTR_38770 [Candidatus Kuenenia stuttgartiensis]